MERIEFPKELRDRWPDILKAAREIGGWFGGYVEETSGLSVEEVFGRPVRPDLPPEPPAEVPVFGEDDDWSTFEHKAMYADWRGYGRDDKEVMAWEFNFGSFSVFRIPQEQSDLLNAGYEDTAGTENERIVPDGDMAIVVYMK